MSQHKNFRGILKLRIHKILKGHLFDSIGVPFFIVLT